MSENQGFDLAGLELFSETQNINPEADYNDMPPPLPDSAEFPSNDPRAKGYLCIPTVVIEANGNIGKLTKKGRPMLTVDWEVQDEGAFPFQTPTPKLGSDGKTPVVGADGKPVMLPGKFSQWPNGTKRAGNAPKFRSWPSTTLNQVNTTEVDTLLNVYYGKKGAGLGLAEGKKIGALYSILSSQRPIRVESQWAARTTGDSGDTFKRRMKNFLDPNTGLYVPITEGKNGEEVQTEAKVCGYNPV